MHSEPTTINEIEDAVRCYTSQLIPCVLLEPISKKPVPSEIRSEPFGQVLAISDPDFAHETLMGWASRHRGVPGVGIYLGPDKNSPILSVDIDGQEGLVTARSLGVNENAEVWAYTTATGNEQVCYWHPPDRELHRLIGANKLPLDLLVNGYAVAPPTVATGKDGVTRRYEWLKGPTDVSVACLDEPPEPLLDWWQSQQEKSRAYGGRANAVTRQSEGNSLLEQLCSQAATIGPGGGTDRFKGRNDFLTHATGRLRRAYPAAEARALALVVNQSFPEPLMQHEASRTISSIANRAGFQPAPGIRASNDRRYW